jgi:protein involved in polysaccharide export with SLBB domain
VSIDAGNADGAATAVTGGDTLFVPEVLQDLDDTIILTGHVQRPGPYQLRPSMRLTDLIPSALDLIPGADADYVLIRREDAATRRVQVVSAKLSEAWGRPDSPENLALLARDTVHVFSLAFGRQRVIAPILEELQLQSSFGEPFNQVQVGGRVRASGTYPLEPGMRVSDLIRAGGNLSEEAFTLEAELTRYAVINDEYRATDVIDIDLDAILRGEDSADLTLQAHDHLSISTIPEWNSEWTVTLEGEVRFPGEYRVRRGETLRQVLERAGGLTDEAFPEGSVFLRESLREREQDQIDLLARRLESDLISLSLQTAETSGAETLNTGRVLLEQLRGTEAVGRLVIDLEALAARAPDAELVDDVDLRDGDRLLVPTQSQVVTVIGEVQQSTSHLFQPGLTRDDYLDMSGGVTRRADRKQIYVVRASGAVVTGRRSLWFGRRGNTDIRPGDTIVAPLDTDRIRPLTFWTNVTQILYQASIAVAAIQSFN